MWFQNHRQYTNTYAVPPQLSETPLARVYPDGKTQPGWGAKDFAISMLKNTFSPEKVIYAFENYQRPFAFLMRAIPVVCIDIDGKNGGIEMAKAMGHLPKTLAEISKSQNGYHLFYKVPDALYDPVLGYNQIPDIIGLVPGIDIKGTGVVYHYPNQKWNSEPIEFLPRHLEQLMDRAASVKRERRLSKEGVEALDDDEKLMLQDSLLVELAKPIPVGSRNNRLFALGVQLATAGVPGWEGALYDRADEIDLDADECTSIIDSIKNYL